MKIAIIGYSGSGKSTLAEKLGEKYGVPVLHLDAVHHMPGWQSRPRESEIEIVSKFLTENDGWVIDGNYKKVCYEQRLNEADSILFLSFNRFSALNRAMKRYRKYKGQVRPDLGEGCPEKMDLQFVRWILHGGRTRKKRLHYKEVVKTYADKITVLKTQKQIDEYEKKLGLQNGESE